MESNIVKSDKKESGRPRWSGKDIMIGQTVPFVALTGVMCYYFIKWANAGLTWLGNRNRTTAAAFKYKYSLGILSPVMLIPAAILAVTFLKMFFNWRLSSMTDEKAEKTYARESKFKWNFIYSILSGYIILILLLTAVNAFATRVVMPSEDMKFLWLGALLYIGALVVSIVVIKKVNKTAVQLTGTNHELVEEIQKGIYDKEILERYHNPKDMDGILKQLQTAQASSVKGAVLLYEAKQLLKKVCKALGVVGIVLGAIAGLLTLGCIWLGESSEGGAVDQAKAAFRNNWDSDAAGRKAQDEKKARDEKWFKANQAEKQAQYSRYQADKAAQYNSNSYDAYAKNNYANNDRVVADRLHRDKYN